MTLLVFSLISVVMSYIFHPSGHNWGDDFTLYINQAKSLLDGEVLKLISRNTFAIENSSFHTFSPTLAPWGFPILLMPIYAIFGLNIMVFKAFIVLTFVLFLRCYFRLLDRKFDRSTATILALFFCTHTGLIVHSGNILSEFPYLLFCLLTLKLIENYTLTNFKIVNAVSLGTLLFFTFNIRSEGALLIISLISLQVKSIVEIRPSIGVALFKWLFLPFIIFLILFYLTPLILPNGYSSHVEDYKLITRETIYGNIDFYQKSFRNFIYPELPYLVFLLIQFIFVFGLIIRSLTDLALSSYTLGLLVLYMFWPFHELRYLYLLTPFVCYFFVHGVKEFYVLIDKKLPYVFYYCLVIILIANFVRASSYVNDFGLPMYAQAEGPEKAEAKEMFKFIRSTDENSVIIFFRPRAMSLYGQRKSAMIFNNQWKEIITVGDYLVIDKYAGAYCQVPPGHPYFNSKSFKLLFTKTYENNKFIVYGKN